MLRKSVSGMSAKDILDMDDESITKAVFQPQKSRISGTIFDVMISSIDSCYIIAGMDGRIISIDQDKMDRMAERRCIDLARYENSVRKFISHYLTKVNSKD